MSMWRTTPRTLGEVIKLLSCATLDATLRRGIDDGMPGKFLKVST